MDDKPVITPINMDFAALYPSIQKAYNILPVDILNKIKRAKREETLKDLLDETEPDKE